MSASGPLGPLVFFISQPIHMLWVLKRTVSMRQMLKLMDKKIKKIFIILRCMLKIFAYLDL